MNDTCNGVLQFVKKANTDFLLIFLFYFKRSCQYSLQTFQLSSKKILKFFTLVFNVSDCELYNGDCRKEPCGFSLPHHAKSHWPLNFSDILLHCGSSRHSYNSGLQPLVLRCSCVCPAVPMWIPRTKFLTISDNFERRSVAICTWHAVTNLSSYEDPKPFIPKHWFEACCEKS